MRPRSAVRTQHRFGAVSPRGRGGRAARDVAQHRLDVGVLADVVLAVALAVGRGLAVVRALVVALALVRALCASLGPLSHGMDVSRISSLAPNVSGDHPKLSGRRPVFWPRPPAAIATLAPPTDIAKRSAVEGQGKGRPMQLICSSGAAWNPYSLHARTTLNIF